MSLVRDLAASYAAKLHEAQARVPRTDGAPLTEAAIAHLPAPMQCWLRRSGAVGRPPLRCLRSGTANEGDFVYGRFVVRHIAFDLGPALSAPSAQPALQARAR